MPFSNPVEYPSHIQKDTHVGHSELKGIVLTDAWMLAISSIRICSCRADCPTGCKPVHIPPPAVQMESI